MRAIVQRVTSASVLIRDDPAHPQDVAGGCSAPPSDASADAACRCTAPPSDASADMACGCTAPPSDASAYAACRCTAPPSDASADMACRCTVSPSDASADAACGCSGPPSDASADVATECRGPSSGHRQGVAASPACAEHSEESCTEHSEESCAEHSEGSVQETRTHRCAGEIGPGLCLFVGVHVDDTDANAKRLAEKIAHLRIFNDADGKMNLSLLDKPGYDVLAVSNFTVYGDTKKNRRPSFAESAPYEKGRELFDAFVAHLRTFGFAVPTGVFGADMEVTLINDGPVTVIVDA